MFLIVLDLKNCRFYFQMIFLPGWSQKKSFIVAVAIHLYYCCACEQIYSLCLSKKEEEVTQQVAGKEEAHNKRRSLK